MVAKPLVATFDHAHASSDGGAVLLRAADRRQLTARMARGLTEARDAERVTHALADLVAQRVFGIACGYPDGNDSDRLADDPIQIVARAPSHLRSRVCLAAHRLTV